MLTDKEITEQIKKQTLDRIPFTFGVSYPTSWLNNVTVEQLIDDAAGQLSVQINLAIPGERIVDMTNSFPATWVDAIKARFFPTWLLRFFPVQFERVTYYTVNNLHPNAP